MTRQDFVLLILENKELANNLIKTLDDIARDHEPLEYGLPTFNDAVKAQMREAIARWVATVGKKAIGLDNQPSCPECGSYAVEQTTRTDFGGYCEYRCEDCGHYFVDKVLATDEKKK